MEEKLQNKLLKQMIVFRFERTDKISRALIPLKKDADVESIASHQASNCEKAPGCQEAVEERGYKTYICDVCPRFKKITIKA